VIYHDKKNTAKETGIRHYQAKKNMPALETNNIGRHETEREEKVSYKGNRAGGGSQGNASIVRGYGKMIEDDRKVWLCYKFTKNVVERKNWEQ